MKTILGLDLGVSSIGWALVKEEATTNELVNAGVRIIPLDSDTVSDFSKGNTTSKNADRRLKRGARRNNDRYKLRRHLLVDFLKEAKVWPFPKNLFELPSIELYGLRDKALNEKIELIELARIWFQLNQKRGYIDSRKGISDDDKDTKYVETIKSRSKHLYDNYKTVGSYFYHKLKENSLYRIKSGDDKENIFLVDDYKLEFDLIWNKQKEFYPEMLNEKNYERVRNQIIYYKRKLKSQKHLIGKCRFEKGHKCLPVSSPIAEELRLRQDVNKLRIKNKYNEEFELTKEQKADLFNFMLETEKISEKDLLKRYQYPSSREGYRVNFEKFQRGYVYRARLIELFNNYKIDFAPYDNFDASQINYSSHPFFMLWHLLYSVEETKDVKKILKEKYSFPDEVIEGLLKLPIKNDFASLSSRAARKLLPFLREGKIYSEACEAVGYNHSDSITKEENENRKLISINELDLIKPNELKNPTVEKILNQLINLLKSLDAEGYKFDEIRIELARDLKKNAKERKRITELNRDNETGNKNIADILSKHGFKRVSRKDIEKYKLWDEFGGCSPYEPGKRIELGDLFNKALYEIEHIIPKSRYFDDSLNNKTIARVNVNKEKDKQTALDYISGKNEELKNQFLESIKHNTKISRTKRKYLLMKGSEIPDDFINRQLNETRYITSATLKLLKKICRDVYSTSGTVTDYLRHHWGYNDVLMELNFDRVLPEEIELIEKDGGDKKKVIKNWSKRLDNRHHAVDAIVIACTKQSYIQQLNTLNKFFDKNGELKSFEIRNKSPFNFETVKKSIENILISYKSGKRVAAYKTVKADKWGRKPGNFGQKMLVPRGSLHEESVYGNNLSYKIIDIKNLHHTEQCVIGWQCELIENHIVKYNNDLKAAIKNLKKDPIKFKDDKILDKVTVFTSEHVKRYNLQYAPTNKFDLKAAKSIVNKNVRDIVIKRLEEFEGDPAKAFKNLKEKSEKNPDGNPLFFNKDKNIVIKTVRCYTGGSGYPALHETANGKTFNEKIGSAEKNKLPVDFVKGGNNHHIAIFEDEYGKRFEECITFFEAFERKRSKQPIIQHNHPQGYKFVMSLQQNEMIVFGISREELENAIRVNNTSLISQYLYRVNDIQEGCYYLLHHLKTDKDKSMKERKLKKVIQCSANSISNLKVKVTRTGKVELIK